MTAHVLVTGATGFVGSALVLELLEQTDVRVTCLVRQKAGVDALDRLRSQLLVAMGQHDRPHLKDDMLARVGVVVGDVTDPALVQAAEQLGSLDAVWHSAASLKHQDSDADEIFTHNVDGTRHVVALAEAAGAAEFNHISTAYVAGRRAGRIFETPVPAGTETNNQYEASKVQGELVVAGSSMHTRVFRPSIVIGHSVTLAADSSMGVYGFFREMHRFIRAASRKGDVPPLTLAAGHDTALNFIPVDLLVSAAVEISLSSTAEQFFHLTNSHDAMVRDAIPIVCEEFGLPAPRFTHDPSELSAIDRLLSRYLDFYLPYLGGERFFDRTNTDAIVGNRCDYPSGPELQRALVTTWKADQQVIELPATDAAAAPTSVG